MIRIPIRATLLLVLSAGLSIGAAVLVAAPGQNQQPYRPGAIVIEGPITKAGWWIRVNPANQAANLSWRFGSQRNRLGTPVRWWKDEYPEEFDLPSAYRTAETLHVAAIGLPYTQPVSFCLFFQDHGAALFEFVAEKNAAVEQNQQDPACTP